MFISRCVLKVKCHANVTHEIFVFEYNWLIFSTPGLSGVIEKNKQIGTVETWGPLYCVSLDLILFSPTTTHSNIIAFKGNEARTNLQNYGDRTPHLELMGTTLVLSSSISGNPHHVFWKTNVRLNQWFNIVIEQSSINETVIWNPKINNYFIQLNWYLSGIFLYKNWGRGDLQSGEHRSETVPRCGSVRWRQLSSPSRWEIQEPGLGTQF